MVRYCETWSRNDIVSRGTDDFDEDQHDGRSLCSSTILQQLGVATQREHVVKFSLGGSHMTTLN